MCLKDEVKTPTLTDRVGYKVVKICHYNTQVYRSLFANTVITEGQWQQAERCGREYGFHAYVTAEAARSAVGLAATADDQAEVVVLEVELADVFLTGLDRSWDDQQYPEGTPPPCVVARAMRVVREIP